MCTKARSATQAATSSLDEVFKRALTNYDTCCTNSTCTSASTCIDKNNTHIFLDSVSKLNLIFWGKTTPTPLNGLAKYFITSSTTIV